MFVSFTVFYGCKCLCYGCRLRFALCVVGDAEGVLGYADGRVEVLTTKHCTSDRGYGAELRGRKHIGNFHSAPFCLAAKLLRVGKGVRATKHELSKDTPYVNLAILWCRN